MYSEILDCQWDSIVSLKHSDTHLLGHLLREDSSAMLALAHEVVVEVQSMNYYLLASQRSLDLFD